MTTATLIPSIKSQMALYAAMPLSDLRTYGRMARIENAGRKGTKRLLTELREHVCKRLVAARAA